MAHDKIAIDIFFPSAYTHTIHAARDRIAAAVKYMEARPHLFHNIFTGFNLPTRCDEQTGEILYDTFNMEERITGFSAKYICPKRASGECHDSVAYHEDNYYNVTRTHANCAGCADRKIATLEFEREIFPENKDLQPRQISAKLPIGDNIKATAETLAEARAVLDEIKRLDAKQAVIITEEGNSIKITINPNKCEMLFCETVCRICHNINEAVRRRAGRVQ